jgi:outer membrane receptor for ferrienterochelin and colicin
MMKRLLLSAFLILSVLFTFAQVTTSSITGIVRGSKKELLAGATIRATHTPSGSIYTAVSTSDGRFTISGMRVGGPYKIEISYTGFGSKVYDDINLQLGVPQELYADLSENASTLTEVTVTGGKRYALISPSRTGPATNISQQQLSTLPTLTRNIDDFTRLTPQAQPRKSGTDGSTLGISFAGANNRYNAFTVDGATATDIFGLASSGTNGGQAALNPLPFDAIEQVQVILAPYDVTLGGFTGGGVNAVTRSGTNTMHGSIYGFHQDQSLVGKSADTTRSKYGTFHDNTYGARLGGAIIKNKLFFFVNYEGETRSQPVANLPGTAQSALRTSALDSISNFLKDKTQHPAWSYDPGAYNGFNKDKKSDAVFARLDWNIDNKNKLTLRHSFVKGHNFNISDATSSMSFYNNGYNFYSTTNSTVLELNSNISSKFANTARLTFTAARDKRATPGALFPSVAISDNGATYNFGTETSSQANALNQNNFTITDNFNIYAGKHTITIGTDNQIYKSSNLFLQGVVGNYSYSTLQSFFQDASGVPTAYGNKYTSAYSTDPKNPRPYANVHFDQLSLYAQDNMQVTDNFKFTYGLRADMPIFANKPPVNPAFNGSAIAMNNNVGSDKVPNTTVLLSPRVGFNWDVHHDHQTQVRGGLGIFTGRIPFVWISNQYSNTGVGTVSGSLTAAQMANANNGAPVHFNPITPFQPAASGIPTVINVTDQHFKYPRTFRTNLAVDQRLPFGLIGTIEGIYTKTLEDISYQDLNLAPATTTLTLGNTSRPFYGKVNNAAFSNVISLGNTTKGYSYNVTASLARPFSNGWAASIAYSLGHSYGTNNGTSSVALSNYRFAYNINGLNNLDEGRNNYDQGSRIIGYVSKKFRYAKVLSTTIGLVYTGQSGQPFSYVYFGDLNGDDGSTPAKLSTSGGADLMYLPTDASQFVTHAGLNLTPAQQFAAFQTYMNSTKYMRTHQGQNTAINADRLPFESHFDLKIEEGIAFYKSHTLSFTADILNVSALLSKNWGHSYTISNQEAQPLDVDHFTTNPNGTITPSFYFNPTFGLDKFTHKPWTYADYLSRWSMQLGLRYSF